jgi:hypothetical protein
MNIVLVLLLLALCSWIAVRNFRRAVRGDDLRILPRVEEEFRTLIVNSEVPELCFDGRTAEIVDDRQEGIFDSSNGYTLLRVNRFARNAHGEYFFFMSEGAGSPFFKHVTQVNAKIALGKKYTAPAQIND